MSAFLDLLYAGADESAFDEVVADAVRDGVSGQDLADLERQRDMAVRLREQMERQRSREAELTALYETANDLIAIRDVDAILAAIVRRARQLLRDYRLVQYDLSVGKRYTEKDLLATP